MSHLPWIRIDAIPHREQRYDTCGDYHYVNYNQGINFKITEMADWRSEAAVFHHEFVEWSWCKVNGVHLEEVDAWDLAHLDADEPGEIEGCPYFEGHRLATIAERALVEALGLTWAEHEEIVARATTQQFPTPGSATAEG
jgi:hypothetical protein